MGGVIIDIEGLDGSGKETQSKILYERLKNKYPNKVQYIAFPDYSSQSSSLAKMYLSGEFGSNPFDVNAYAASSFFAVDRFSSYNKFWKKDYLAGKFIIANRYTSSNALYQMPKFPQDEWEDYLTWSYDYEYNKLGIPRPTMTIYLDVPVSISQKLMDERYLGNPDCKDIHESSVIYLNSCYSAGIYASKRDGWTVISCVNSNTLRSVDDINNEIISSIKNKCSNIL